MEALYRDFFIVFRIVVEQQTTSEKEDKVWSARESVWLVLNVVASMSDSIRFFVIVWAISVMCRCNVPVYCYIVLVPVIDIKSASNKFTLSLNSA